MEERKRDVKEKGERGRDVCVREKDTRVRQLLDERRKKKQKDEYGYVMGETGGEKKEKKKQNKHGRENKSEI